MSYSFQAQIACVLFAAIFGGTRALGKVVDDGPQHLDEMSSIGKVLQNAGSRSVHILYVHGMDAMGSGDSLIFQKGICEILKDCTQPSSAIRDYADSGVYKDGVTPPPFEYMSKPVWSTTDEWSASAPFVDHYVIQRSQGGPIVIDEINWWPLVFPIKCRNIISGEARQAGPDAALLNLCSLAMEKDTEHPGRFKSYPWMSSEEAATLKAMPRRGALANRWLKNNILDWGVSDAFMVVGSMHSLFQEGMRQLFVKTARFHSDGAKNSEWLNQLQNPQGLDREFVVVSHSLGSYLVFSTLNVNKQGITSLNVSDQSSDDPDTQDAAAQYILERTSLVYFFANQVALLELADVDMPAAGALEAHVAKVQPPPKPALSKHITHWSTLRQSFKQRIAGSAYLVPQPPELFAWSDPSDLLTFHVPPIPGVKVDNLYVRNSWWHWLIANPSTVHIDYAKNKAVLKIMMRL